MIKKLVLISCFVPVLLFTGCYKAISENRDVHLGELTSNKIHSDPGKYKVLSRKQYPVAYTQINRVVDNILGSDEIQYRGTFKYDSITLLQDDKMINAFCTPGGFIFVYTGLIKQAENEDQLASVIAHEIAHAELRHSVKKLSRGIGRQAIIIAAVAAASASFGVFLAVEVANKILGLGLSRNQEDMADKHSVIYLGTTNVYSATALADFFQSLVSNGKDVNMPPILSTHPDTKNRIKRIRKWGKKFKFNIAYSTQTHFKTLQNSLP